MSGVSVWYLKYVTMRTSFAHPITIICMFVTRPGWRHWQVEICSLYDLETCEEYWSENCLDALFMYRLCVIDGIAVDYVFS